ncbi:hypothetical protein TWF694_008245 [Orbilia ellipsospora]|uniref:Ankyrin repeat protein n=1 Tax=Orbilia ellipsospora TaxID=2528407 RepID=A0AAV9XIW9_9PEZI
MGIDLKRNRNRSECFYSTQLPILWNEFTAVDPYEIQIAESQSQRGIHLPTLIEIIDGETNPTKGMSENKSKQVGARNCFLAAYLESLDFKNPNFCLEERFPDLKQFVLDLETFGVNNTQQLLDEALCVTDSHPQFVQYLVERLVQYSRHMSTPQIQSLLRLAIQAKLLPAIQEILNSDSELPIPALFFGAAVWSDDTTILHTIWEAYFLRGGSLDAIECMLIIPICTGNLYNVLKFVDCCDMDINRLLANKFTYIELAACLGRIEIAQVLLQKGAVNNLEKASKFALDSSHFALAAMIKDALDGIYIERSFKPTQHVESGPARPGGHEFPKIDTGISAVGASSKDIFMGWSEDSDS